MTRRTKLLAAVALLALLAIAAGEPFDLKSNPANYARSAGQAGTYQQTISSTATYMARGTKSGAGLVFGFDSMSPMSGSFAWTACWSMDRTAEIGARATVAATQLATATATITSCPGYSYAANESWTLIPMFGLMRGAGKPAYTGLWCNRPVKGAHGGLVYPPCRSGEADCAILGAGAAATCTRTTSKGGGVILLMKGAEDESTTIVRMNKER